MLKYQHQDFV